MNWYADYIGIPFVDGGRDMKGLDCWGLIVRVYADHLGINLPSYGEVSAHNLLAIARSMEAGKDAWVEPSEPKPFDLVPMRLHNRSWIGHVGLLIDKHRLIHVEEGIHVAEVPLDHHTIRFRAAGFRRYAGA